MLVHMMHVQEAAELPFYSYDLPSLTRQEVFDVCVARLIMQGEFSVTKDGRCLYRHEKKDGTVVRCIAGGLLDEVLSKRVSESHGHNVIWGALIRKEFVPEDHGEFIGLLQEEHDRLARSEKPAMTLLERRQFIAEAFEKFAIQHGLNWRFSMPVTVYDTKEI